MKLFNVKLLVLFTGIFSVQISYAQDSIPLSLNLAIQLALDKNTNIVTANFQVNHAEFALKEAKGNFLPKLNLNANYNRSIDRQVIFLPENFGIENRATKLGSDNEFRSSLNLSLPDSIQQKYINAINQEDDVKAARKVYVIGETIRQELFSGVDTIGRKTKIDKTPFTVVGLLEELGKGTMGQDQDEIFIAPYTTIQNRLAGYRSGYNMIMASDISENHIADAEIEIMEL